MSQQLEIRQSEKYEGGKWWKWAVWVDGSENDLDRVDLVQWILDPSFPEPVRTASNRAEKFKLETAGWGVFPITARIQMKDGDILRLIHYLKLHYPDGTENTD